jgi:HD superfamily phosphodiesterase
MTMIRTLAIAMLLSCQAAHAAAWRDKVTAFAAENFKNPAWGFSHCQRDYRLAREMAAADHVTLDDDVLFAAAYLHDMAAFDKWAEEKKEHGDVAAEKIDIVLGDTDFPKAKLDAVRAAIRTHMFNFTPVGPEARYLHDADALDWLGAIGIARMLPFADKKGGKPSTADMIKSIKANLAAAPKGVVTPAGKARIPGLIAEENAFLDALAKESANFSEL